MKPLVFPTARAAFFTKFEELPWASLPVEVVAGLLDKARGVAALHRDPHTLEFAMAAGAVNAGHFTGRLVAETLGLTYEAFSASAAAHGCPLTA